MESDRAELIHDRVLRLEGFDMTQINVRLGKTAFA